MIGFNAFGGTALAVVADGAVRGTRVLPAAGNRVSVPGYVGVSPFGFGWRLAVPAAAAAAAAAAMSAARHATAGHVADIPQHKRIAKHFASVNWGNT